MPAVDLHIHKQRLQDVIQLLTIGLTANEIFKYSQKKEWNISYRSICRYMQIGRKTILNKTNKKIEYYIWRGLRRYDDLYQKMYMNQDYKGCLTAQEKLEKLLGIGSININMNHNEEITGLNNDAEITLYHNFIDELTKLRNDTNAQ